MAEDRMTMAGAADNTAGQLRGHIRINGLSKGFVDKDGGSVSVIENCSLELEPGMLNVVMGKSGCGKSTLAYLLAGYIKPDAGSIEIDGRAVSAPGPDRIMVFQETALWPWMTVTDNVIFGPLVRNEISRAEARQKAEELLERFGLIDFKDKYPSQLSGGMKRRAEIAQALINSPDVMILDEPFRGLDVMTRELLQEYYLQLFEDTRLTTLFITSELEEALFLADRIYVMGEAPDNIKQVIEIDLERPRSFEVTATERYLELKQIAMEYLYAGLEESF
jgi:NitT/TauT family transport system ATP-binding protein